MSRRLAGLALIALCAGLAWLWSAGRRDGDARAARPEASEELTPAQGHHSEARLETPGPDEVRDGEPLSTSSAPPGSRAVLGHAELGEQTGAADLVVEVVDPTGTARAGIPLRLELSRSAQGEGELAPDPLVSDARGRVVFRGLRERVAPAGQAWILLADLPFEKQPSLSLDAAALAASSVRFELPPGGELDVRVRELDGAPAPSGSLLRLMLLPPDQLREPDPRGPQWKQPLELGALQFPWVQLGCDWELAAWRPKGAEPTRLLTRGPDRLGERVERELVLGSDHPVVGFRVLDPEGRPLSRAALELARGSFFGSLEKMALTTDGEGRFVIDGQASFFTRGGGFFVTSRPAGGAVWTGRSSLPEQRVRGWNDGGDIRLESEPLLVAGRVVDERGAPVAGADVRVGEEQAWGFGEPETVRGTSDGQGSFELRGMYTEEWFQVHARSARARSRYVEASHGTTNVVLVLRPRFTLSGTLLLDPGIDPGMVRFACESPGTKRIDLPSRQEPVFTLDDQGNSVDAQADPSRFELEPIEGGVFDFLCLLENAELMRIPGVALHSDLDLGPLDLRGKISLVEIEFVGDGDLSGLSGEYSWWPSGRDERRHGSFSGPLVQIASAHAPLDVELRPSGYRRALLEDVRGRRQHRLEAPLRVRLVLSTSGALPAPPHRFDCDLYQDGSASSQPDGARWFTPERNEIRFLVASPGRHEVRWRLERKIDGDGFGGASARHVLNEHWTPIEILDVPGEQVFLVPLDGASLDQLSRALQ